MAPKVVSFLVSGQGSNFSAVMERIESEDINAVPGILISDKGGAPALRKAEDFGMKSVWVNPKDYASKKEYEEALIELFAGCKTDLIVAAGFMRILSPFFVRSFANRIINIHPSLLPAFAGKDAQEQALDYGVKLAGCTAHFIDEGIDSGPIIMQAAVPVLFEDNAASLSKKILREEHRILPESVKLFCEDRLSVEGRKVFIRSSNIMP